MILVNPVYRANRVHRVSMVYQAKKVTEATLGFQVLGDHPVKEASPVTQVSDR